MKAYLRDAKILAAKQRDAQMIEQMPESYRPKKEIESTREMQKYMVACLIKNKQEQEKEERKKKEEVYRKRYAFIITNPETGEKQEIQEIKDIQYAENMMLKPDTKIEE